MGSNKKKKTGNGKIAIIIISVFLGLAVIGGVLGILLFRFTSNLFDGSTDEEISKLTIDTQTVERMLYQDFRNGEISTDEYVKYSLYSVYDNNLLSEKYSDANIGINSTDPDKLVEEYFDELSDETLKYYFDKCMMTDVTFVLGKENAELDSVGSLDDLFVMKAYASEGTITNLDKIAVSSDKKVFVWYTTDGNSACTEEEAQSIANKMENTIIQYEELFDCEYTFEAKVYSKGNNYEKQVEILEKYGYSSQRLEDTLQVYVFDYGAESSLAQHQMIPEGALEFYYKICGGDEVGAVANPHIRINTNAMGDMEKLEQLYNHELFHEFQEGTLSNGGERDFNRENKIIMESTANLASAYVTDKTTVHGYLNINASNAMRLNRELLSEKNIEAIGTEATGYAFFVYLYNYAENVPNGLERIVDAMYEEEPLEYLNAVQQYDLIATQRETGIKYLNHIDYDNKNLVPDPNHNDGAQGPRTEVTVDWTTLYKANREDEVINPIGIEYYDFACDYEDYDYTIKFTRENYGISAYLLGFIDGKYQIVDFIENTDVSKYTFKPHLYEDAIEFNLMIVNPSLLEEATYSLEFERKEAVGEAGSVGHMSFVVNEPYDEDVEKYIHTFYYNAEGKVCRYVVTSYLKNEEIAQSWYEYNLSEEVTYIQNHIDGTVVTVEYAYDIAAQMGETIDVEQLKEWKAEPNRSIAIGYGEYIDFTPIF